jgi:dihydroorotase-like cyclic amidohydrolase
VHGPLLTPPICNSAHVHLNEPGRTSWEGFATGTQAAVFGGITTLVDMPLNSLPPTTTVENLEIKRKAAEGQCWADVGFWGGVIPGNEVGFPSCDVCGGLKSDQVLTGASAATRPCRNPRIQMFSRTVGC